MGLVFPAVVAAVVRSCAAPGADQSAVDQDDVATRSDDFLQHALQALGPRGKQFDHLQDPTTHRRGGDVVAARHVGKPLVMAENREDDRGDLPGRQLAPPGADLLQMAAEQVAEEGQGGRGQLQTGLVDNRLSAPGRAGLL
ncbi:hypothetical protein [Streptomyces sp. R35]|uniref:Secreted protein n=1 Tax=Streptomyces sp. R35 TaxID=3238630 RepID=A0AB39SMS4_9ACTN